MAALAELTLRDGTAVLLREAAAADIGTIVALLADDPLGVAREAVAPDAPDAPAYARAFAAIDADPRQLLVVGTDRDGTVVATLQLSFLPGLSRGGAWRAQIEAVRVAAPVRGRGMGEALMQWAIDAARARGCALVQLTSDKSRADAHRFYGRLGFVASHEGYKLALT